MQYVPILRLGSVESKLIQNELNGLKILPLLEITHKKTLQDWSGTIARNFKGDYMVELPLYLLYTLNRHTSEIASIMKTIPTNSGVSVQAGFYIQNKKWIKIPVVSSEENDMNASYDNLLITYKELKGNFTKIAIRIFISHIQLSPLQKAKLKLIFDSLREGDIILLDVMGLEGIEQPVLTNLEEIVKIIPKNETYLLNAFDIRTSYSDVHNYSPLLAKKFGFAGFGDFATSLRYEPTGGSQGRKIIRYYVGDYQNKLVHFPYATYSDSLNAMKASNYWQQAVNRKHNLNCRGCMSLSTWNEGHRFWKKFRILHHIFSMLHDTIPRVVRHTNFQDVDPDGYANLYNKGSSNNGVDGQGV